MAFRVRVAGGLRARLATVGAAALLAVPAHAATEIEAGVLYPGGTRLTAAEFGVSFTVPAGWRGAWPAGSEFFVMEPMAGGATLLAAADRASAIELETFLGSSIDLGGGAVLEPVGAVRSEQGVLTAAYRVEGAPQPLEAEARAIVAEHGVSVAYLLVASQQQLATHRSTLGALVSGTDLEPIAAAQTSGGEASGNQSWAEYLRGKYIVRYYTTTGFTDEQHLWLCSDGSFSRSASSGGFGGGASGAFQSGSSGRWEAAGSGANGTLTLHYGDGTVARHELYWDYDKNQLFVDGKRWLHGTNEHCS